MTTYNTWGMDDVCIGLMNVLSVSHQYFEPSVLYRNLSDNLSILSFVDFMISFVTLFLNNLYF